MNQEKIINSFSIIYWSAIQKYNDLASDLETVDSYTFKRFTSEIKASLKWPLKHCGTLMPPNASKKALEIASKHGIDLFALQWKDQQKAEGIISGVRGRNIFVHEHKIPVCIIYEKLLSANSLDMVKNILSMQTIVWITKEENRLLPQYIRDKDAYEKASIEYELNPYNDHWMEKPWRINYNKNKV